MDTIPTFPFLKTNPGETYQSNVCNNINTKLITIKKQCEIKFKNNYTVFFTTDNRNILDNIIKIFNKSKVIYENNLIQHLDRNPQNPDISKIFIDNYILSQKTKLLYISSRSSYGRIAALSCNHNNIYDLNSNLLNKKTLLSKGEMLF